MRVDRVLAAFDLDEHADRRFVDRDHDVVRRANSSRYFS